MFYLSITGGALFSCECFFMGYSLRPSLDIPLRCSVILARSRASFLAFFLGHRDGVKHTHTHTHTHTHPIHLSLLLRSPPHPPTPPPHTSLCLSSHPVSQTPNSQLYQSSVRGPSLKKQAVTYTLVAPGDHINLHCYLVPGTRPIILKTGRGRRPLWLRINFFECWPCRAVRTQLRVKEKAECFFAIGVKRRSVRLVHQVAYISQTITNVGNNVRYILYNTYIINYIVKLIVGSPVGKLV